MGETSLSSQGFAVSGAGLTVEQLAEFGDHGNAAVITDEEHQPLSAIVDFVISGLTTPGVAVPVVLPLPDGVVLPANAQYRKFNPQSGWETFAASNGNALASASRNSEGSCPAIGDQSYQSGLTEGDHCIQLTIVDGAIYYGDGDADGEANGQIVDPGVITVENLKPVAAVSTQTLSVLEGAGVTIDGSASFDPEGQTLSWQWLQTAGTSAALIDSDSAVLAFNAPLVDGNERLTFTLVVNDGTHDSVPVVVEVMVEVMVNNNQLPIAVAVVSEDSVNEGDTVRLTGAASSDAENSELSYHWQQLSGTAVTLADADTATASFVAPAVTGDETLTFALVVNDGQQDSMAAQVSVVIKNVAPPAANENNSGGGSLWLLICLLLPLFVLRRKKACLGH